MYVQNLFLLANKFLLLGADKTILADKDKAEFPSLDIDNYAFGMDTSCSEVLYMHYFVSATA